MRITKDQARQILIAITKNATSEENRIDTYDKIEVDTLYTQWDTEWLTSFLNTDPNARHREYFDTFDQEPFFDEYGIFNNKYVDIQINLAGNNNYVYIRLYTIKDKYIKNSISDMNKKQMIFLSEYTLTDYDDIVEVLRSKLNVTI